jgi:hypothetical protein
VSSLGYDSTCNCCLRGGFEFEAGKRNAMRMEEFGGVSKMEGIASITKADKCYSGNQRVQDVNEKAWE